MTFQHSLENLRRALQDEPGGREMCYVRRRDLRELIEDWERLDAKARDTYNRLMRASIDNLRNKKEPK
ncbi:MAG TPA: hypothetical protein VLA89_19225 [Gemmatimonadales bacterium]|nr:hypothetical protein [Gemmatimonadales bacterium]